MNKTHARKKVTNLEYESIKKIYAGYSKVYDALFKRFFYPRIKHAISYMDIKPGERVLDVGVGTGLSLPLFPRHCKVVGIDLSTEMLKQAKDKIRKNRLDNISVIGMDAMRVGFGDNSFDKVFLSHVVSVVPDPYKAMAEVKRVCKKGGQVVIVNHFKSRNKVIEAVEKVINPFCKKIGWRSDMCLNEFIEKSGLKVYRQYMLKKIDFWHIVFATNEK
ncbi:MAG: methyltransferase domain-containing protein [Deltaproteobacteria bacterium]|nr:methyltransferase domain-containing protein [Deltaproteobacteria bacterium]